MISTFATAWLFSLWSFLGWVDTAPIVEDVDTAPIVEDDES
jgi:hypothetical protein